MNILSISFSLFIISSTASASFVNCSSLDLRSVPVGTICSTSKSAVFERVFRENFGEAWKGPDGIIWSDVVGEAKFENKAELCDNIHAELPSEIEVQKYIDFGYGEVLPNLKDLYWTSTEYTTQYGRGGIVCHYGGCWDTVRLYANIRCIER